MHIFNIIVFEKLLRFKTLPKLMLVTSTIKYKKFGFRHLFNIEYYQILCD